MEVGRRGCVRTLAKAALGQRVACVTHDGLRELVWDLMLWRGMVPMTILLSVRRSLLVGEMMWATV